MQFIRDKWFGLIVLAAIILSFIVSDHESQARDSAQHSQIVQSCVRGSARTALIVNSQLILSDRVGRRANPGDQESARQYRANARSLVDLIPAPQALQGSLIMAEVTPVRDEAGEIVKYKLTKYALHLQRTGCEQANGS